MSKKQGVRYKNEVDSALESVGSLGKFQIRTSLILWLSNAVANMAVVSYVFIGFEPKYRCAVPECGEIPFESDYEIPRYFQDAFGNETEKNIGQCRTFSTDSTANCDQFAANLLTDHHDEARYVCMYVQWAPLNVTTSVPTLFGPNKRLVPLSVVTLTGVHCMYIWLYGE